MNRQTLLLALLVLASSAPWCFSQDPAAKGLEIAQEAKRRDTGYGDFTVSATMTLRNAQGQTSVRKLDVKTLEDGGKGEKALIIFREPADIDGTALLSYSFKTENDDQWLYLPSIKRVKRIASGNKSGSFVGTEFSYEDISPQQVEKYTYKYIGDEIVNNLDCYIVERYPKDESGYTKQVIWIDKAEYRPLKIENYDRKNAMFKILAFRGYQQYAGKFWRPDEAVMVNKETGKSTYIVYTNYQFKTGLKPDDFERNVLERLQ